MKKRIFLIVSSIICCLVSLSLVIYTIVKASSVENPVDPGQTENPIVDTNLPGQEITQTVDVRYNMIVGDTIVDDTLLNNTGLLPSFLTVQDGKIVAIDAGHEIFVVEYNGSKHNFEINVWTKGTGTSEDPFNIIRVSDLVKLAETNNSVDVHYVQRMDLDLAGQNWKPIGSASKPFCSNYDGNGYTIKNMSIVVNAENLDEYVDNTYGFNAVYLGFFGFTYSNGEQNSVIKNVNIENATIDTTIIDKATLIEMFDINQMYVGALAGYMYNTSVAGSESTISAVIKSSAGDHNGVDGAVGGLVGCVRGVSTIEGYSVNTVINATKASYVDEDSKVYGATVAGLVGNATGVKIKDCKVNTDILVGNYSGTKVAGIIINAEGNTQIENVIVESLTVKVSKVMSDAEKCVRIAGAVDFLAEGSKIANSHVLSSQVYAIGTGQVSGFVQTNNAIVKDCSVKGSLKGVYVAGFAYKNNNSILYTNDADVSAVDVEIEAQLWGAGVALYNNGRITGATNKTSVVAQIYWYKVAEEYFDKNNTILSGIATVNAGRIENLYVTACMYDAVNAGGAIGAVNGENATLTNCEISTTVRTIKEVKDSEIQTYTIGGIVAIINLSSKIEINNVKVTMSVNNKALTSAVYTLDTFGGIVGLCLGSFEANKLELGVSVYANDTIGVDAYGNCATVRSLVGAHENITSTLSDSKLEGVALTEITRQVIADDRNSEEPKFNIRGNVNVNGTVTSLLNYDTI